ncbi:MAG: hypothetical protein R3A45_07025 [Bdellovibrionota bacterium]
MIDAQQSLFDQQLLKTDGRIRHLTLEQVTNDESLEIVVYARKGSFPNWVGTLHVFEQDTSGSKLALHSKVNIPAETIYYGFLLMQGQSYLLLVMPDKVSVVPYKAGNWLLKQGKDFPLQSLTEPWAKSTAIPFQPVLAVDGEQQVWIPTATGYQVFKISGNELLQESFVSLSPKSFYRSSYDLLPFEMSYWFQNVFWYPQMFPGTLGGEKQVLFSPWMDELDIVIPSQGYAVDKHYFRILSEQERDDGTHYLINQPIDLNGDGLTDF